MPSSLHQGSGRQTCRHCSQAYEITQGDLAFYEKVSPVFNGKKELIPPPTLCPECRQQRRLSWRNERNLYHRKCDRTGKQMIAMYAPEHPLVIYDQHEWWSDQWDPLNFGREYDASRSFFAQFHNLQCVVPRPALYQKNVENSDFTNHVENVKNCYLSVDTGAASENIYFSKWIISSRDLCDCYQLEASELCYESQYSVGNYGCIFVYLSHQSRDSAFLYDCKDCNHCFLCTGLQHQSYCIENVQKTKEEYEEFLREVDLGSHATFSRCKERYLEILKGTVAHKATRLINCEECSGDYMENCKGVRDSYDVIESQDCRYCYDAGFLRDCYDTYESAFDCELQYEGYACNRGKQLIASCACYDVHDVYYSDICHNSHDLLGCIGLRQKSYCILNKQYTKEEYECLVPMIIERMRHDGEWGEFFPSSLSLFGYNESVAQDFFPLTKNEILSQGWIWHDTEQQRGQYMGPPYEIPDRIVDVPDDITKQILTCEVTGKPYKIIPQELKFYREMNIPIPRKCPDQRHKERMALRNPRKLWSRQCVKCQKDIQTTYSPERPEIVYCEECYLKSVY